jgi:hypothetical protein
MKVLSESVFSKHVRVGKAYAIRIKLRTANALKICLITDVL